MRVLRDYRGLAIRLSNERLRHILDHPEMIGMEPAIPETLEYPETVVRSISDEQARLYYRLYQGTLVGEKFLCVVVKVPEEDAFILTAYLTDRIKRGEILWSSERGEP